MPDEKLDEYQKDSLKYLASDTLREIWGASAEDTKRILEEAFIKAAVIAVDHYCPTCGSCGIDDCCPAPRCAYFDVYAKGDLAEQLQDMHEDNEMLRSLLKQIQEGRSEETETLRRESESQG